MDFRVPPYNLIISNQLVLKVLLIFSLISHEGGGGSRRSNRKTMGWNK
jgi:hypothetical protein